MSKIDETVGEPDDVGAHGHPAASRTTDADPSLRPLNESVTRIRGGAFWRPFRVSGAQET